MQSTDLNKFRKLIKQQPILTHSVLAILVFSIFIFLILRGLSVYTLHGKVITVPNVKGLQIEEATVFFVNSGLRYNVIDSVFTKDVKPGAILEVIPTFGSKVKRGRIVFITINAKNAQKAAIPDIKNVSFRQASALIKAQGFTSVETKYIPGRYRDLVIGVELNGKNLEPGELVPLSSALILKISDGGSQSDANETQSDRTGTVEEN
jgi:beta-lactam-binding protein with PASTA domain